MFYNEILRRHRQNLVYYAHSNKFRIVEGKEYNRIRAEYITMTNRGETEKASGRRLWSFQYNLNGSLTHQTDVTGRMTEYCYDLSGYHAVNSNVSTIRWKQN